MIGERNGIKAKALFPRRLTAARLGPAKIEHGHALRPAMAHQAIIHQLIGPQPPRVGDAAAPKGDDPAMMVERQHGGYRTVAVIDGQDVGVVSKLVEHFAKQARGEDRRAQIADAFGKYAIMVTDQPVGPAHVHMQRRVGERLAQFRPMLARNGEQFSFVVGRNRAGKAQMTAVMPRPVIRWSVAAAQFDRPHR